MCSVSGRPSCASFIAFILMCFLSPLCLFSQYHFQPQWGKDTSPSGQIVVESQDRSAHPPILNLITHIRNELAPILGLPTLWRDRLLFRIEGAVLYEKFNPDLVTYLPSEPFRITLWLRPKAYDFQLTATSWPQPPEELVRQCVAIFIYEKALSRYIKLKANDYLPAIPLWLSEGLTQALFVKKHDTWTAIVRRTHSIGRSPTLRQILSWKQLSTDTLHRAWQQAHAYHLVTWLTRDTMARAEFQRQILQLFPRMDRREGPLLWPDPDKLEPLWQAYLKNIPRTSNLILSWEETAAQLTRLQKITLNNPDDTIPTILTLDRLHEALDHPQAPAAIAEKIREFIDLELTAQFAWRPVIASFRLALENLLQPTPNPQAYRQHLSQAKAWALHMQEHRTGLDDYLNWFEITHLRSTAQKNFAAYFTLVEQLQSFNLRQNDLFAPTIPISSP